MSDLNDHNLVITEKTFTPIQGYCLQKLLKTFTKLYNCHTDLVNK